MGEFQRSTNATVIGFRKNDTDTLRTTYEAVYPLVRAHVLKNNGSEAQAKDVFQEAFVTCWKNIKEDRFYDGNVAGYLFTIAKNKWTDHLRSALYKKTLSSETAFIDVVTEEAEEDRSLEEESKRAAMLTAMAQLGDRCKTLLKLFYFERRSMEEISSKMGMAPNSARNQKYRCMEKLRTLSLQHKCHGK